jgi:DNA-binding response OmpR family regulator
VRVLLVEDEPAVATGVRRGLTAEGFDVDVATNGEDGLRLGLAGRYDVVLLDVLLPKVNGFEICRTLRSHGITASILMLTAKTGEWDVAEAFEFGADDYLTKPFSMVELLARIRARARVPGDSHRSTLSNGDLRFDPPLRRCWRGDVQIDLTGRETSLLTALFQHVDQVVSKETLLEAAWGTDAGGDTNTVEVYVARLRRKLDAPAGDDDIETIRGEGYRLVSRDPLPRRGR